MEQSTDTSPGQDKALGAPQNPAPSKLQLSLATDILALIKSRGYGVGHHLVEIELCNHFSVSRTPVRAAMAMLAEHGVVEHRANRGFVVANPAAHVEDLFVRPDPDEEETRLFIAIAQAQINGRLPRECTQQELIRQFNAKLGVVVRVLRQLAELGLVERKPGNGWSFLPSIDSEQAQRESYQFRLMIEPATLLEKSFAPDPKWLRHMRERHEEFRKLRWRDTLAVEFYEMNADFHLGLAAASHNRYLIAAMEQQNKLRRFLNYSWDFGIDRVHNSIDEHLDILKAVETRDMELAAVLMRRHLMLAGSSL